jgi:hypothetical protein
MCRLGCPRAEGGSSTAFWLEGDYFDECTCTISCPCIFLNEATEDDCDGIFAWHIARGNKDGLDLTDLNVAMAWHSGKQMQDGNWKVALYIDERASADQSNALQAIFGGQAGGLFESIAPLVGEIVGVFPANISFDKTNGARGLQIQDVIEMRAEELREEGEDQPTVFTDAPFMAVPQGLRQGRTETLRYSGVWSFETSGTNAFINEFRYEA